MEAGRVRAQVSAIFKSTPKFRSLFRLEKAQPAREADLAWVVLTGIPKRLNMKRDIEAEKSQQTPSFRFGFTMPRPTVFIIFPPPIMVPRDMARETKRIKPMGTGIFEVFAGLMDKLIIRRKIPINFWPS